MSDPALALQKAIVAALRTGSPTEAGTNVFDAVPSSNPFPRVTVGDGQTIGDFADCYDGSEVFMQIDVWSHATGYPEAKRIASEIREILHDAPLDLDGHSLVLLEFQDSVYSREADGITSRARMTFRALTVPEDASGT